ncbi:MAG TPA: hypothetical protein VF374_00485 [Thermoplasmata archaeon]
MAGIDKKRVRAALVVLFASIYYIARIALSYADMTGSMEFETEQSELVEAIVIFSFLAIGVLGLLTLSGVYLAKPWGYWGTMAVSAYTIVFDIWAFLAVQSSAIAGVIPPAVLTGYLLVARRSHSGRQSDWGDR